MEVPLSDSDLVRQYLRGDEDALRTLFSRYLSLVFRFVARLAPHGTDVDDVVQESFVKAWKHLRKFDQDRSFKAWIFTIAKNTLFDALKKRRDLPMSERVDEDGELVPGDETADKRPLSDEMLEKAELAKEMEALLLTLPLAQRTIVVLHAIEDLSFRTIGEMIGKPMETVKTRYYRAISTLRQRIEPKSPSKS